jgi:hypothetical protein
MEELKPEGKKPAVGGEFLPVLQTAHACRKL